MKMDDKIQAVNEIFVGTVTQQNFIKAFGLESAKTIASKLDSAIAKYEEDEAAAKAKQEAELKEQIDKLMDFARLQLSEEEGKNEDVVRAKAKELFSVLQGSAPSPKAATTRKESPTFKFYSLNGEVVERKFARPSASFKDALEKAGFGKDQYKLLHKDSVASYIEYQQNKKPKLKETELEEQMKFLKERNIEEILAKLK
ncbi:hypothetical protein AAIA71_11580 [Vibrio harveyi]|uniref:hypothetical protein n=1 Tax=Vibrio harveyi TaxID=669 RepID=UPI0031BAD5DD